MDWQPGDLALCVRGGYIDGPNWNIARPILGRIYTIEKAALRNLSYCSPRLFLWLTDGPPNNSGEKCWVAIRFVKVTPPEADAFDRETIELYTKAPTRPIREVTGCTA